MSLVSNEGEGEQNEIRILQDKLGSTMKLVSHLTAQLNELKEQVRALPCPAPRCLASGRGCWGPLLGPSGAGQPQQVWSREAVPVGTVVTGGSGIQLLLLGSPGPEHLPLPLVVPIALVAPLTGRVSPSCARPGVCVELTENAGEADICAAAQLGPWGLGCPHPDWTRLTPDDGAAQTQAAPGLC